MAVVKPGSSRSFRAALRYISREGKTHEHLMTGIRCCSDPKQALIEWQVTKKVYGQTTGRSCIVMVQSWAAAEQITPELAHQIGVETVNRWNKYKDYQVFVSTHVDQKNGCLHNHIASNSVNMETGKKWQMTKQELAELRALSDQICREHGLTITVKGKTFEEAKREEATTYTKESYRVFEKASQGKMDSWVVNTALKIMTAKEQAVSKEDFCNRLNQAGVLVNWSDTRKNITFQCVEGVGQSGKAAQKIRDSKLSQYFHVDFNKDVFEDEFARNAQQQQNQNRTGAILDQGTRAQGTKDTGIAAGVESSIHQDRELVELGYSAAASAAARAERERAERERREADERAREIEEQQQRERETVAAAARRAAAERKAARANGSSIAD